jgi:hypothetical protein
MEKVWIILPLLKICRKSPDNPWVRGIMRKKSDELIVRLYLP